MAQSIVLKRSALSGKVPDTSSLSLGEIAINTYDGRVFFKKSGSLESVQHIVTTDSITTGSITLTKTGSFGELLVTQDANFQRDIFVTRDIVSNGDIDILGSFTASLANGYVWVGDGQNKTTLVATSSFGGSFTADVQLLISKTGSYATTASNNFVGDQIIAGNLLPATSNSYDLGSTSSYWRDAYFESTGSINFVNNANEIVTTITSTTGGGIQIGSIVITTSSIVFVDDQGNTTETIAQSSSAGQVSNFLTTSSFELYTSSVDSKITTLISKTGSYATTGSNNFIGNQIISGSLILTSSLTLNNTSNQILVRNTGSGDVEYSNISSLLNTKNLVTVGASGSKGVQFNSIKAAVNSITDASEYNTYTVRVGPGIFYETEIAMKSWVTVKGDSTTTTIVSASNASASVFIGADQSMVIDMQVQGTTAPSQSAIVYSSPTTPQTNAIFYVENVRFGTNYTHAKVIGTSGGNCIMQCSNVKYGGYPFTLGFHVTNDGSGIGRMQLRNVTSTNGGVTTSTGLIFAKADQPGCTFIVNGCLLTKAVGVAAGTGFWVENGGSLRLTAVNFQRWEKAIYAPNVGSAPSIFGSALNFENNTYDVLVEHTSATGHVEGADTFLKTIIPANAPLYEINTDPRKLVVAKKGGDFTSISASVAWITDSSETNRYTIEVGPGEFTENVIDLRNKPYVSIFGADIQATHIMPLGNHHQFILGNTNEVSFVSLMGNNASGYAAFLAEDLDGFALIHKISIYDWHTGIKLVGNASSSQFYGEYVDINGPFTYGTYTSASNGTFTNLSMENYYLFPSGGVSTGNYAIGTGAELDLYTSVFAGDSVSGSSAIYLADGAVSEVAGLDVQAWDYGVYVPNMGTAPTFRIVGGMIHDSLTYDFNILKTGTQGRFQGISNHSKINNVSSDFYWNFLDDADGENDVTRKLSVTFADGTHTDATTLIFNGSAMGVMSGGTITIVSGLTISTAAGFGYCEKASSPEVYQRIDWNDSQLILPANSENYIYINESGLTYSPTKPSYLENIIVGRVVTNSTGIEFIDQSSYNAAHTANLLSNFNREALGPVYANGSIVTENVVPKKLNITAGSYYFSENNFTPAGTSSINLNQYFRSGSSWSRSTSPIVPTDLYNSGSGGTLIPLSASAYTKHTLYGVGDGVDEKYFLVIGQNQYDTLVEAEGAGLPTPPDYFDRGVVSIASIYVQSGSSNITQIEDIRPVIGFKASGVNASSTHANLLGLTADDHPQYLLTDGGRTLTGNINLGGNDITNVDTITANTIVGSINATNGVVSGSSQVLNILTSLNSYTSSNDTKFTTLQNVTSSINQYTASANNRLSSLENFTSSLDVTYVNQTELATVTGSLINSIATKLNTSSFETYTSSIDTKFTTLANVTTSVSSRLNNLESFTASLDVTYVNQTELATVTGSLINSIATKLNTSSFETHTGSIDTKFTTLANVTASLINATSSYETKGRGIVSGSSQITSLLPVGTVSGSSQVIGILSSLNSYTASNDTTNTTQNSRLTSLESFTSSLDVTYVNQTELANATGSLINSIATKLNTSSFESYTGSIDTKFTTLSNTTASLNASTASQQNSIDLLGLFSSSQNTKNSTLATYTSSIDTKFTTLATYTGSIETKNSTLATYTGSVDTKFTTLSNITSSLNTFTSSANSRLNNLESFTASLDTTYVNQTELASATGSLINSIGTKLNTSSFETYTGSVDNKFVNLQNTTSSLNTHTASVNSRLSNIESFTSSLDITYVNQTELATATGSLINSIATKLNTSSFQIYTGSVDTKLIEIGIVTASLINSASSDASKFATLSITTASYDSRFTTLQNVTASLNSYTASANSRFSNLESFTASLDLTYVNQTELANATGSLINSIATKLNTSSFEAYTSSTDNKISNLNSYTASASIRLTNLEITSASLLTETNNLELFTSSQNTKNSTLATYTSSQDTKNTTLATYTGSVDTKWTTLSNVTASLNLYTSSQDTKNTTLANYTSSLETKNSTLATYTGSINNSITLLNSSTASQQTSIDTLNTFSGSEITKNSTLATYTGSIDTKWTTLSNVTASLISNTGSYATTGSNTFIGNQRITGNLEITGSFDLRNAEFNATASNSSAGNVLVSQNQTGSYISAFYNYAISSGSNMRAGQIMSIWSGSVIRYTEVTTTDIGSTANVNFSASINAGNVLLHLSSSGVWNVRSIVNLL